MPLRRRVPRLRLIPATAEEPPATPAPAPAKKTTRSRRHAATAGCPAAGRAADGAGEGRSGAGTLAPPRPGRHRWRHPAGGGGGEAAVHHAAFARVHRVGQGVAAGSRTRGAARDHRRPACRGGSACGGGPDASVPGPCRLSTVFREAGADLGRLWALPPRRDPIALAPSCWPCSMRTATAPPTVSWPLQVRRWGSTGGRSCAVCCRAASLACRAGVDETTSSRVAASWCRYACGSCPISRAMSTPTSPPSRPAGGELRGRHRGTADRPSPPG